MDPAKKKKKRKKKKNKITKKKINFLSLKRDLLKQRHAKITERFTARRFGVLLTSLKKINQLKDEILGCNQSIG